MVKSRLLIVSRVSFGLLALTALTVQFSIHVLNGFSVVNFFSYFTNLSNVFAAIVLLTAAAHVPGVHRPDKHFDMVRGAATVGMALVGVVYVVLLRQEDLGALLPWINVVIHYVMPVVAVADWLYDPPETNMSSRDLRWWLIFPLLYLAYSLIRGADTGWYAYPFLNPDMKGGYVAVAAYCVGILMSFLLFGWLLMRVTNRPHAQLHHLVRPKRRRAKNHGKA